MKRPPLDVITRELLELRSERAKRRWSRAERARYAELVRMEREALLELREREADRPESRLSVLAERVSGLPYDPSIDTLRDDPDERDDFSALRARPRVRPVTT